MSWKSWRYFGKTNDDEKNILLYDQGLTEVVTATGALFVPNLHLILKHVKYLIISHCSQVLRKIGTFWHNWEYLIIVEPQLFLSIKRASLKYFSFSYKILFLHICPNTSNISMEFRFS